ncbi:hypothetical protein AWC38_SpisGene8366 [Stylophora pistillata]|uniref:Uncharacterized protein n=1 Tax=Stylophora pistillata TaxID=50429 RepID=A0A2B4SC65_STYPI|nr:hypothetical protein AWC38_SpisGene8366 [Stylophora pistillata]
MGNPRLLLQIRFTVQGRKVVIPLRHDADDEKENSTSRTMQHVPVAKDEGLISDEAHHELRMALPDKERDILPPISVLRQERNRQNGIINLHSIPEAKKGDGERCNKKATFSQLLSTQSLKNTVHANGNELHLHFATDGRHTSNKIRTVMAVFNILNEQEHDCDHQYPITLYNGSPILAYFLVRLSVTMTVSLPVPLSGWNVLSQDINSYTKNFDEQAFVADLDQAPFSLISLSDDPDFQLNLLNSILVEHIDRHAPLRCVHFTRPPAPCMKTEEIQLLQANRDELRKAAPQTHTAAAWGAF